MDTTTTITTTAAPPVSVTDRPKNKAKGKVTKLKLATRGFRPGGMVTEQIGMPVYSVSIGIPLTDVIGSAEEVSTVHGFVSGLSHTASTAQVGNVDRLLITKGVAEVLLRLTVPADFPAEPTDEQKDALVSEAFRRLNDYFSQSETLKRGNSGRIATWAFKVNGSVLDDGHF